MPGTVIAFEAAAFLGAFLAFDLELLTAKVLLPRFGGSACVWTTCAMCFQALLVAAYGWCRAAEGRWGARRYARAHLALLAASAIVVFLHAPAVVVAGWNPAPEMLAANPFARAAWAVAALAGVPFLALSTTSVVLQGWLESSGLPGGRDPYFLFAASNAGALGGLFAYVLVLEPLLSVDAHLRLWSVLYLLFVGLHGVCAPPPLASRSLAEGEATGEVDHRGARGPSARPSAEFPVRRLAAWFLWSAAPCAATLAATNFLALDFASAPLLWVAPLSVYLVTLILAFQRDPWPGDRPYALSAALSAWTAACVAAGLAAAGTRGGLARPGGLRAARLVAETGGLAAALFAFATACHRSLARDRPDRGRTIYYLSLAAGGWFGSFCVGVLVPWLGRGSASLWLDAASAAVLGAAGFVAGAGALNPAPAAAAALGAAALGAWAGISGGPAAGKTVFKLRNFYGIYEVVDQGGFRRLMHGDTNHGMQSLDPALQGVPQFYYNRASPLHDVFESLGADARDVAVVGLGAGGVAPYGRPGTRMDFYELDPDVAMIAGTYFTYLKATRARARVVLGDARLSLERASGEAYDLLLLDAFSSGAMPTHLLTEEALRLYLSRLKPDGLILVHVSNRFLELRPMLAAAARDLGLAGAAREIPRRSFREEEAVPSSWVALGRDPARTLRLISGWGWVPLPAAAAGRSAAPWTDRHASLLSCLAF